MDIKSIDDGNFIITGRTNSNEDDDLKILLFKINTSGEKVWQKTYDCGEWGQVVLQTEDNGFIIAGGTYDRGDDQLVLLKTDSKGSEEWSKLFGGIGSEDAHDLKISQDEGYIVIGRSDGNLYLVKTNESGDEQWTKKFEGIGYDVQLPREGGLFLTGYKNIESKGTEVYVIKMDSSGNEIWSKLMEVRMMMMLDVHWSYLMVDGLLQAVRVHSVLVVEIYMY